MLSGVPETFGLRFRVVCDAVVGTFGVIQGLWTTTFSLRATEGENLYTGVRPWSLCRLGDTGGM